MRSAAAAQLFQSVAAQKLISYLALTKQANGLRSLQSSQLCGTAPGISRFIARL